MARHIVLNGLHKPVDFEVRSWSETGYYFGKKPKRPRTTVVLNHWTNSENSPAQVYQNMQEERTTVHFVVDPKGGIFQMLDASAWGAHCRACGANEWSVGIEYISRGGALDSVPHKGVVRTERTEPIRGKLVRYAEMTPQQVDAGCLLNEALCRLFRLPMQVPQLAGDVFTGTFTEAEAIKVRGVCGHYQFEPKKNDPAPHFLRLLHAYGSHVGPPPAVA